MANKRVQKKQVKKTQVKTLQQKGYSEKEIKQLYPSERNKKVSAYKAAETRERLKQERINSWREFGVPDFIIQRDKLYLKQNDTLTQKQRNEIKRKAIKEEQLKQAGYSYTKSDLNLGWGKLSEKFPKITPPDDYKPRGTSGNKKINENVNITFTTKDYLYVGFADTMGESFGYQYFQHMNREELRDIIDQRLFEAKNLPDDSSSYGGSFIILHGSRDEMEMMAREYYRRGYSMNPKHLKMTQERYNKVTISNRWTEIDFLEMTATIIHQTRNDAVGQIWRELRRYCNENNLPFLKGLPPINYFKH